VITVEEGRGIVMEKEYTEGMQFDRGFISPYMATNQDRTEAELSDPYVLVTDRKISALADILPILEKVLQSGRKELFAALSRQTKRRWFLEHCRQRQRRRERV